jgi:Holliday junction resolvasome RuvABC endonuclease subunit
VALFIGEIDMKILSFDQSTRVTGHSLFIDGRYVKSGVIDLHTIKNTDERSKQMGLEICRIIEECQPDEIIIEEVAMQSNADTLKKLARIQGMAIGFATAHNIPTHILAPTRWRSVLNFTQGPKVKREQLKNQSRDFVKNVLGLSIESEDEIEATAINEAAHRIYGFEDEI